MTTRIENIGNTTFTLINFNGGSTLFFNHSTLSIRYNSIAGGCFITEHSDDDWVAMMNRYSLWK